jgi:HEAT repeat protein
MAAVDYRFALPQVRGFLRHRLAAVRCAALAAVARWRDHESGEPARQMAREDPSAFVRPAAVSALGEVLGEAALPDLEALAGDANALVRAAVAEALGRLGTARAWELLGPLTGDLSPSVARAAREALARGPGGVPAPAATAGPEHLPAELRGQAAAARAFLERWQAGLSGAAGELAGALETLLRALAA